MADVGALDQDPWEQNWEQYAAKRSLKWPFCSQKNLRPHLHPTIGNNLGTEPAENGVKPLIGADQKAKRRFRPMSCWRRANGRPGLEEPLAGAARTSWAGDPRPGPDLVVEIV